MNINLNNLKHLILNYEAKDLPIYQGNFYKFHGIDKEIKPLIKMFNDGVYGVNYEVLICADALYILRARSTKLDKLIDDYARQM